jgi:hypothetical protein
MTRTLVVVAVALVVTGFVEPARAAAQNGQDATIVGQVFDASGGAIANAVVSVAGAALIGGPRSVITDASGKFRIPALSPGRYEAEVFVPNFDVRRADLLLLAGAVVTADFVLVPAGINQSVRVSADQLTVDVHTTASSNVIQREVLDNLPLSRDVSAYVNLAPGVVKDVAFGSSVRSNPLFLDGASGNEASWGTPTTSPSASWIDELQVISLGADAQFGEFTGALSNAITRSGSDRLAGLADNWTTRQSWVASNSAGLPQDLADRFRPVEILARRSFVAQAGGPLKKQRAWFFVGSDLYRNATRPAGFASVNNPPETAVDDLFEPKWLAKITAAASPSLRIEGYLGHDSSTETGANASPTTMPEALTVYHGPETLWNTRLTWVANDRFPVEAKSGGSAASDIYGPSDPAAIAGPPAHTDGVTGIVSGNATSYGTTYTRPVNAGVTVTRYAGASHERDHELKAGLEFEADRWRQESGFPGGMLYYDLNGQPSEVYIQAPVQYRPDHRRETVFVQDSWAAWPHVTINAGVRVCFYQGAISGFATQI